MSQQAPATIKVLPARLANQIAAGEVVERPASVLKELLENSIDAGATQVDIDIEKGGHKKIKITDNGAGIAKEQLMLALSRHATSKVSELDDLENIHTLGFRGEALASISSVSRLTLTSRTAEQSEAWQARTEGRDMRVQVEPAAHPQGTSVEVLDLFFNTPARRKFLRTEKTEFNHIEELFNRIALSRYDVGLRLKHNGKLLKNLPAIVNAEPLKRIKQLCGASICDGLLQVDGQYQGFRLHGWVSGPGYHRAMSDIQFVFVNNRMMRDKLIFHAVRQAYEGLLPHDKFPYFMLYLEVPFSEVDVNVHPAKHEVRFHQSRLVHDFIFSALNDALNDAMQPKLDSSKVSAEIAQPQAECDLFSPAANPETQLKPEVQHNYRSESANSRQATDDSQQAGGDPQHAGSDAQPDTDYITPLQPARHGGSTKGYYRPEPAQQIKEAASQYTRLMTVPLATDAIGNDDTLSATQGSEGLSHESHHFAPDSNTSGYLDSTRQGIVTADILQVQGRGLLLRWQQEYYFLGQSALLQQHLKASLSAVSQPLLVPVSIKVSNANFDEDVLAEAANTGIELQWTGKKLILKKVPAGTREQNWQLILNELVELKTADPNSEVLRALALHWKFPESESAEQSALFLWQQINAQQQQALLEKYAVNVPLLDWLAEQSK